MDLEIVDGVAAGGWIKPEMRGFGGGVADNLPARYDAYVRILHPASLEGALVTWRQVADELGRQVHPLAQWGAIVGASRYRRKTSDWPGRPPELGELPEVLIFALTEVLTGFSRGPERCFFAVWTSWWDDGGGATSRRYFVPSSDVREALRSGASPPTPEPRQAYFAAKDLERRLLDLGGGREYRVVSGPMKFASELPDVFTTSPQMMWPEDRAWFLASEIDFDSTLVGGNKELARQIIEDERFEAFEVGPDDLLTWNADEINPPLPP